jgi:TonB family protein
MGLWEFLRQWPRGPMIAGIAASILVHGLLAWVVLWGLMGSPEPRWTPRKGDTIIVELPESTEPARAGTPSPPAPAVARPEPAPSPTPAAPPSAPVRPAPPRPEERRVATAPRPVEPPPAVRPPEPAPRPPEPVRAPEPAQRAPEPPPAVAESAPSPAERVAAAGPPPAAPRPAEPMSPPAGASTEAPSGPDRQVASLPPGRPAPSLGDVRAALRQGAGGRGQGRGGIEGDPIPLDSADARYSEYLEQIRRRIKAKWGFPCVRNAATRECDHHTTSLDVQFGILRDGRVQFVEVVRPASHAIYDDYALNAIKLASPFPPVPPAIMATLRPGSAGMPLSVRFSYVVESSLTNLLR